MKNEEFSCCESYTNSSFFILYTSFRPLLNSALAYPSFRGRAELRPWSATLNRVKEASESTLFTLSHLSTHIIYILFLFFNSKENDDYDKLLIVSEEKGCFSCTVTYHHERKSYADGINRF